MINRVENKLFHNFNGKYKKNTHVISSAENKILVSDLVSFKAKEIPDEDLVKFISKFFETPFKKSNNVFLSKHIFDLSSANQYKQYYNALHARTKILLGVYAGKDELKYLAKVGYDYERLNSMVFLGFGDTIIKLDGFKGLFSNLKVMPLKLNANRISSDILSPKMLKTLQEEFKASDEIVTNIRKEQFKITRELVDPTDKNSPIRYISIEKVEKIN